MAPLVTQPDYEMVRDLIDPELDADELPDSWIERAPYLPAAEAEVARRLPDNTSVDAKRAVLYLTAAYMAHLFPQPQSASLGDFRYQLPANAVGDLERRLTQRADDAIASAEVAALGDTAQRTPQFVVFTPSRYQG